jgi:hypothetical protein
MFCAPIFPPNTAILFFTSEHLNGFFDNSLSQNVQHLNGFFDNSLSQNVQHLRQHFCSF